MNDKVAWFDMDEVLADYAGQLSRDLKKKGIDVAPGSWWVNKVPNDVWKVMQDIKSEEEWWENLPVVQSGLELVRLCVKIGFHIGVLTKAPSISGAWEGKYKWFIKNVKSICADADLFVISGDKSLVYGRVLVDDSPDYMGSWLSARPRGLGLMPTYSFNADYTHIGIIRYEPNSIDVSSQIESALRRAFNRKAGSEV